MKRGHKASITIYLALVFWVLTSLIFTVIENVRSQAAMLSLECAMDLSLYSVFAEYHRELLEQYDLFFIDTGYGNMPSTENTKAHLKGYLEDNFDLTTVGGIRMCDFLQMQVQQVEITGFAKATDEGGAVLKRQAVDYMKERYGVSYLEKMSKQFRGSLEEVTDYDLLTRDVAAEREANRQRIDAIDIPPLQISEDEYEEVVLENPADAVDATRSAGILHLVVEDVGALSGESVNLEQYVSGRSITEGYGLGDRKGSSKIEDLWYHEYLLDKCSCYTNPLEKAKLKYQAEYIIAGKNNDLDNLKWVAGRLLLIREVANVVYLFNDPTKVLEAQALAMTLAAVMRAPDLVEPVKNSILFAWAYAESVYDVKQLLLGKRLPLIKDSDSWHYSLEGMLHYQNDLSGGSLEEGDVSPISGDAAAGLDYKDYLRIFLFTVSEKDSIFRMMDIIEMDVRQTKGNQNFYIDACVDDLKAKVSAGTGFGNTWQIEREYCFF